MSTSRMVAVAALAAGIQCASAAEYTRCKLPDGSVEFRVGKCNADSTELGVSTTLDSTELSSRRSEDSPPSDAYVEGLRPEVRAYHDRELLAQQCRLAPSLRYARYRNACPHASPTYVRRNPARRDSDEPKPGDWNYIPRGSSDENHAERRERINEANHVPRLPARVQVINPYNGKVVPNAIPTDPFGAIDPRTGKRMQLATPIEPQ